MQPNSPHDETPQTERSAFDRRLSDDHSPGSHGLAGAGGHGNDMGWLVSYADMMTLLFGLFVLLYTLASDKKGDVEKNMLQISEQHFSQSGKDASVPQHQTKIEISASAIAEMKAELERLKQIPDQRELVVKLNQYIEDLKKMQNPNREEALQQLEAELQKLRMIPDQRELVTQLKKEIEELKKEQLVNREELVKKLNEELKLARQVPDQRTLVNQLQMQLEEAKKQVEEQTQIQEEQKRKLASTDNKNFMIISTTWSTEKHDVDLVVIDPEGFKYTFKNKRSPQSIGSFEIDSRYGPGLELWKSANLKPGKYQISVRLYNQFGNMKDAAIKTQIVTKLSNIELQAELNAKSKEKNYVVNVNQEGEVSVE